MSGKLGDIPLEDYLRIAQPGGPRRPRPSRRWVRPAALAFLCVLAFAAGQVAPTIGKGAYRLQREEAEQTLADPVAETWNREHAVVAISSEATSAVGLLSDAAVAGGPQDQRARMHAVAGLRNVALAAIRGLRAAAASDGSEKAVQYLDDVRAEAGKPN